MQKIIDTHCHYNLEPLFSQRARFLIDAKKAGVIQSICVGTSIKSSHRAISIANENVEIYATCGIHPNECQRSVTTIKAVDEEIEKLKNLLKINQSNQKIVAIGEIGLDFYRLKKKGQKRDEIENLQTKLLRAQLQLAAEYELPVILHVRDQKNRKENNAYWKTLEIVTDYLNQSNVNLQIILHCFSGPLNYIQRFLEMGAYIGIAGNITYKSADDLRTILHTVPQERILLETDAPYLSPEPIKTEFCQPKQIVHTAEYLASHFNINLDIIVKNTYRVFPTLKQN